MKVDLQRAAEMWAMNVTASAIADELGTNERYIYNIAEHHRDLFPVRRAIAYPSKRLKLGTPVVAPAPASRNMKVDRVVRITVSGAKVTLARIPTIDGPAPEDSKGLISDITDKGHGRLL